MVPEPPPRRGALKAILAGLVVLALVAGSIVVAYLWTHRAPPPRRPPLPTPPAGARRETPSPPERRAAGPAPSPRVAATDATALTIETDVPGADVFIDRRFVGRAPLTLRGVASGTHRLNVSAEGHDGHAETIEVTGQPQTIAVRLKEVRLDESVAVVHRHGIGSCRGWLAATPSGLRYEASKSEDAFALPLEEVQELTVDYMAKTLRVRGRGGRTYNFNEPSGNTDALLSFQQRVEEARKRLVK